MPGVRVSAGPRPLPHHDPRRADRPVCSPTAPGAGRSPRVFADRPVCSPAGPGYRPLSERRLRPANPTPIGYDIGAPSAGHRPSPVPRRAASQRRRAAAARTAAPCHPAPAGSPPPTPGHHRPGRATRWCRAPRPGVSAATATIGAGRVCRVGGGTPGYGRGWACACGRGHQGVPGNQRVASTRPTVTGRVSGPRMMLALRRRGAPPRRRPGIVSASMRSAMPASSRASGAPMQ